VGRGPRTNKAVFLKERRTDIFFQKLSKAFLIQKYTSRCYETGHPTLSVGYDAKNRGGYVEVVIKFFLT
jgi:hypothetical protein